MKKEDIRLGDWHRLFIGEAPLEFMLEVVLRTLIIYLVPLLTMRLLSQRMTAQLNVMELSLMLMLMLGGVVSVGMQLPDRGLLLSTFTLACLLVLYRVHGGQRRVQRVRAKAAQARPLGAAPAG
jgi:hypothetical protein